MEDADYIRFIHDMFEFNDTKAVVKIYEVKTGNSEVPLPNIRQKQEPRELLVDILAFCLMPNHFHLMLRQRVDGGVTKFMRKLGTGYTNYFNQKYARVGALFQGVYKMTHINRESHFIYLPFYIHLNPLDMVEPKWREGEIMDFNKTVNFLESYRWSSYMDYIGKKNFPSVTQREFLMKFFGGSKQYGEDTLKWLRDMNLAGIKGVLME